MNAFIVFMSLALVAVVVNIVFSMLIVHALRKRNMKINFIFLKLYLPKYAHQYKQLSLQETGKVGALFYGWLMSINAAWILAVIGLIAKASY